MSKQIIKINVLFILYTQCEYIALFVGLQQYSLLPIIGYSVSNIDFS